MDYEIRLVPEGTYAVIKRTVAFPDVPNVMPEHMGKVQSWADTVPHGVQMCISSTTPDGQLNIAPGVEVEPGRGRAARRLRPGDATRAAVGGARLHRPL